MNRSELQSETMKIIYNAKWQITLSGEADRRYCGLDEFYMEDENKVFAEICKLLGVKVEE